MASKLAGNGRGAITEHAEQQAKAVASVRALLATFADDTIPTTGNWGNPSRRWGACGIHYASVEKNSMSELCFAIDTSGSVNAETVDNMLAIMADVFRSSQFEKLHVIWFNSEVYATQVYKQGDRFKLPQIETGGTDFHCVFDYAKTQKCKALIMLTDGVADIPQKPKFPVAWLLCGYYQNENLPFGKIIKID